MHLVDIGVNLDHRLFQGDRDQVIDRAVKAGVTTMIVTGTDLRTSESAAELAARYPDTLYSTAGVHPHNARSCNKDTMGSLRRLAAHREVVAIGECGLDYNRDFSPRVEQDRWFEAQVELAAELKLPLFLHERDAHTRFIEILRAHRGSFASAVVHCFTGSGEELKAYLDLGLHIGITGWICDERRGLHLREIVRTVPLERLMLETDAPFLVPRNIPSKPKNGRNEPAFLPFVLRTVADSLKMSVEEIAARTTATAVEFFGMRRT